MKLLKMTFLFISLALSMQLSAHAQPLTLNTTNDRYRYFTVSGSAVVHVRPDRVSLTLGIHDRTSNLNTAKDNMARVIRDVIAFSQKNGIESKHIQTANIQIEPRYSSNSKNGLELEYYLVQQSLTVTLNDVDKYNQIIYGVMDLGINTIENIQFSSSKAREHRDQARLNAIQAAREKATLLTSAVGIKLGEIVYVTEDSGYSSYYAQRSPMNANSVQNAYQSPMGSGHDGDDASSAAGMISVSSTVQLTYKIAE